jgi:hypothetical protein
MMWLTGFNIHIHSIATHRRLDVGSPEAPAQQGYLKKKQTIFLEPLKKDQIRQIKRCDFRYFFSLLQYDDRVKAFQEATPGDRTELHPGYYLFMSVI